MTSPKTALHGVRIAFDNTYARLPERFYALQAPTPVSDPRLIKLNTAVAEELGLDAETLSSQEGVEILAGSRVAAGSEPLAQAYAGHQFGHFVPTLGDGRAILLGEVSGRDGNRYDIQLKGSGITAFSRRGDGRAALGPVLREYIVSEAMAAMGVPTTRALAAVATGDAVFREVPLPGAVLTRVAASHLRVGTFEYFAARGDTDAIRTLADYAIERHYPDAAQSAHRYRAFLDGVVARQSRLIAQWMQLGFIHGVMNTDNCAISGETIDYGPCAFMEAYDAYTVFSSIDSQGRYAYGNQPRIALWNLTRLAEALMPLLQEESGSQDAGVASATQALEGFPPQYSAAFLSGLRAKLGLYSEEEGDVQLAQDLLDTMAAGEADFTLTFRRLADAAIGPEHDAAVRVLFKDGARYDAWATRWRARIARESVVPEDRARRVRAANPIYIPRNHLVERAISAAAERRDFQPFEDLLGAIAKPFEERSGLERFAKPAQLEERVLQTFCGT
jgi:uncharacterized protein YdiU (UPF0061 family)